MQTKLILSTKTETRIPALIDFPRKRLLVLSLVVGFMAWGSGGAKAQLVNGLLDLSEISSQTGPTPTGWIVESSRSISGTFIDGASSEGFANFADPGGKGVFFKPFQGNATDGNLTVHLYQDIPGMPGGKYTLTGYAGAEANYSGLIPGSGTKSEFAVEFLDAGTSVIGGSTNDLRASGLGSSGSPFGYAQYSVMATAPVGTVTVRSRASIIDAFANPAGGGQAFVVDAFVLAAEAPPGSPVITNQPVHKTVSLGTNVSFSVGVSNTAGVSYQWQLNMTNLANGGGISGATTGTLTITGVSATNVGHYRVLVGNGTGTVISEEATLAIVGISFYPTVTIVGKAGDTYRVDYATALSPTTWIPLSTNTLTSSPQLVLDSGSPNSNQRFYRAVYLP